MRRSSYSALFAGVCCIAASAKGDQKLVVHEWGTFTCLQDEAGQGIGGINTNDEPLPDFVYEVTPALLLPDTPATDRSKGLARCHSDVTMRLETPVIYFYPGEEFHSPLHVSVSWSSGWLTEYFPSATVESLGLTRDYIGPILPFTRGSLDWKNVNLSASEERRPTLSRVWLAPRAVDSATVEVNGEHEKFLFYRGVAKKEAPLKVVRSGPEFLITSRHEPNIEIRELWLVDVRGDGTTAFRVLHPFNEETAFVVRTAAQFAPEDYSHEAAAKLREAMGNALRGAGLFEDEADALLATWQISYFQSAGLRLFLSRSAELDRT